MFYEFEEFFFFQPLLKIGRKFLQTLKGLVPKAYIEKTSNVPKTIFSLIAKRKTTTDVISKDVNYFMTIDFQ